MAEFLDLLAFELPDPTQEMVVLTESLRYRGNDGSLFTMPASFETDLASVPAWLRLLAPPWQQCARAGVLHDCAYRWYEVWEVERKSMDRHFYEALRADGTGRLRARGMQGAVRLFGRRAWKCWRRTPAAAKGVRPAPIA
jgi:hypothetical protein